MAGGTIATIALVAGAGAATYGAVKGVQTQKKISRAQQQQAAIAQQQAAEQRKAQALQERRSRRSAIRRNQVARATALSSAQSAGGFGGSAVSGGIQSASSRLGGALGFGSQMSGISQNISELSMQSADIGGQIAGYRGDLAQARGIGQLGGTVFQTAAGTDAGQEALQGFFG
jgi:Na+-translocating ferredoxin:NAD+ oxidoreductase RnfC subunit